jgi:hypothetical protein
VEIEFSWALVLASLGMLCGVTVFELEKKDGYRKVLRTESSFRVDRLPRQPGALLGAL